MWNMKLCWWVFQLRQNPGCVLPFDRFLPPTRVLQQRIRLIWTGLVAESCRPSSVHVKKLICWHHQVFTTGSRLAHVGRFEFSKIQILAVNFIMGDKWCLCCFPSFLFKKTRSNIKALTTTVCLPFVLSSKNDVLRKVVSSACNSNDCAVFLERAVLWCADGSLWTLHSSQCWKVCTGLRWNQTSPRMLHQGHSEVRRVCVVEHRVTARWTPLPCLKTGAGLRHHAFAPQGQMATQWKGQVLASHDDRCGLADPWKGSQGPHTCERRPT